ncbi:MAG: helix-turn-helix transcriptional regulator [Sedimentisphaerales bacterium]|nr:helix-turn-helix transcriptional regulator [Sedimentisphaerales bacterium]
MISELQAEHVADVLKAVAHPVRLQIVAYLDEVGRACVGDIMAAVGGKAAITSQQLNMMRDKNVLAREREGSKVYYRIDNPNVIKLLECVYNQCAAGSPVGTNAVKPQGDKRCESDLSR